MDEQQIFIKALELDDPHELKVFLDQACAGNEQLRARLERMLQSSHSSESFMEEPLSLLDGQGQGSELTASFVRDDSAGADLHSARRETDECAVGAIIGPYTLRQKLGEGGMGAVFLAEQKEPVKRRVALKVIKEGMNSHAILSRFEAERQALSLMDHPNIARVLDAGQTSGGKPFFVMELVKGLPINNYCDAHRLDTRQRLELIKPICQAVQHAHQKGIVHRDLKPSNILVAEYDETVVPKVIDFGIAKALHQPLTDSTLCTQIGQIIGTLEYMSPEQAKVNELDIDTRSDIYSLGVLLYELLTGSTPYDRNRLRRAALAELVRIIQDEPPPLPSQRLSSSETLPQIAASRATSPARLSSLVRGELDWIVMKAMEKDRNRRYQTCTSLLEDIDRYLNNQPVSACPPSKLYLVSKFVRRNKVLATAGVLVLLSMLLAIGAASWGLYHANLSRMAEQKKGELERQSKMAAVEAREKAEAITAEKTMALEREQRQRAFAEAVTRFVRDDFLALTSVEGQLRFGDAATTPLGKDATLQNLLDRAANKLDARRDLDPLTVATLRWMIGVNYRGMGLYELAVTHLKQSSALFSQELGEENAETLRARNEWAIAELKCGNRSEAIAMLRSILETQRRLGLADGEPVLTTMNNLAIALQENGQFGAAIELFEKIAEARSGASEVNLDRLRSTNNLADCYRAAGRVKEAIPLHEKVYTTRKQLLPETDPRVIQSLANLAVCYLIEGQLDKALPLHEEAAERMSKVLESNHPDLFTIKNNIAIGFQIAGKYQQALQLHRQVYEARRQQLGEKHSDTLTSLSDLAESYRLCGNYQQALKLHAEALAGRREVLPAGHQGIIHSLNNLAMCCHIDERYLQALGCYKECLQLMKSAATDPNHPDILSVANNMALCQAKLGRFAEAIESLEKILEARTKTIPKHPLTFTSMHNLAECRILKGDVTSGVELLHRALDSKREHLPAGHPEILESMALLGKTECEQGQVDAGLERLRDVAEKVKQYSTLWSVRDEIRSVLRKRNMHEQLSEQITIDIPLARDVLQADELQLALALAAIGKDLLDIGNYSQAQPLIEESLQLNRKHAPDHPRIAAVESLIARAQIDQAEVNPDGARRGALQQAERRLDACYRIQVERVKLAPTLEFYDQLQFTVDQLVRVTGLLEIADRHQQWRSVQKSIGSARDKFGK